VLAKAGRTGLKDDEVEVDWGVGSGRTVAMVLLVCVLVNAGGFEAGRGGDLIESLSDEGRDENIDVGLELGADESGGDLTTKGSESDAVSAVRGSATLRRDGPRAKGLLARSDTPS